MYIYVCVSTSIYVKYIYLSIYVYMCIYRYVSIYLNIYISISRYLDIYLYIYIYICICTYWLNPGFVGSDIRRRRARVRGGRGGGGDVARRSDNAGGNISIYVSRADMYLYMSKCTSLVNPMFVGSDARHTHSAMRRGWSGCCDFVRRSCGARGYILMYMRI